MPFYGVDDSQRNGRILDSGIGEFLFFELVEFGDFWMHLIKMDVPDAQISQLGEIRQAGENFLAALKCDAHSNGTLIVERKAARIFCP